MDTNSVKRSLEKMFKEVAHIEVFEVRYDLPGGNSVTLTVKVLDYTGSLPDDDAYYAFAYAEGISGHVAAVHSMPSPESAVEALFREELETNLRFALSGIDQ